MRRVLGSLRFQLIAIVVATVATVLVAEQWVDTRLSERSMERDLKDRGLLYLRTVDSLLSHTGTEALRRELAAIVEGDRELTAIDVLRWRDGRFEPFITTRAPAEGRTPKLEPDAESTLLRDGFVRVEVPGHDGTPSWRMAMPVLRSGRLVGATDVDVSLAEIYRLEHTLRLTDFAFLASAIILISCLDRKSVV